MHTSLSIIIGAFTLGFVGGAIPGPVLTSILTEIIETTFLKSLKVLLFAMAVETCVRLFALLVAGSLPFDGAAFQLLSIVGALILLRIATKVWRIHGVAASGMSFTMKTLALMIVCNGMLWMYWLTVCVPDAVALGKLLPFGQYLFLLVFEAGWFLSTFLVAALFAGFKPLFSHPRIMPLLFKVFALVFVGFAFKMLEGSVRFFLG